MTLMWAEVTCIDSPVLFLWMDKAACWHVGSMLARTRQLCHLAIWRYGLRPVA